MVFFMLQIQLLFVFLHSKMKKSMKKVYSIALLAIIMIVCLQGYNMHLQYQKYKLKCIDEINDMLVQSVDEEYHDRAKSKNNPDKKEEYHIRYKVFNATDKIQEKIIKEPGLDLQTLDIGSLKVTTQHPLWA
jgi:hypothetical protein